jgi:HlyD family secretion protein
MASSSEQKSSPRSSFYRHAWLGVGIVALLLGGLLAWAATTQLAGAVVASGTVVVEGGTKRVQHHEGGIVQQILVRNEDRVEAGDVLLRLDGTTVAADLAVVNAQLAEALTLQARLQAESLDEAQMVLTAAAVPVDDLVNLEDLLAAQDRLRASRQSVRDSRNRQLEEQIVQLGVQIEGLEAQHSAVSRQAELMAEEVRDMEHLFAQSLIDASRLKAVQRELARLEGDKGRLVADMAAARAAIAEKEFQIAQSTDEFQASVLEQLQTVNQQVAELMQRRIAARDRLAKLDIRAPRAGIVHQSIVETVGGVVAPGETLMLIVPQDSRLIIEAQVSPMDVDRLVLGQTVSLRMVGLDARTTPELNAEVAALSPDLSHDQATGMSFYAARIQIPETELARLPDGQVLVPGMPAEAFIETGDRSVLSYLLHPLTEQLAHTFREAD